MGNNQPTFHKRERTNDGSQRTTSGSISLPLANATMSSDDGFPVQMRIKNTDDFDPALDFLDANEYPVVFKWANQAGHSVKNVHLCGSWDQWKVKIPLVKSTSDFSTIISLSPGAYEYKFSVDGKWMVDNTAPKCDNSGAINNVIHIDEADFEVFDALDKDLASSNAGMAMQKMNSTGLPQSHDTPNDREIEKLRDFTQTLPDRREFERAQNPPILPPHLLQVILNKDTPVSCDPNVLPEPNHVMLNHLYALSIKDGVMISMAINLLPKKYYDLRLNAHAEEILEENCFNIKIKLTRVDGEKTNVSISIVPMEGMEYELLITFVLTIDDEEHWVDADLWKDAREVYSDTLNKNAFHLSFGTKVHEILAPRSIQTDSLRKNFRILSCNGERFVNTAELNQLGGSLFRDWHERNQRGETAACAPAIHEDDLETLLIACCAYSTVVVNRQNFEVLLSIGWEYRIYGVLRAVERYILDAKGIHPIKKLEMIIFFFAFFLLVVISCRKWYRLPPPNDVLMVVLGSGGHTMEMLKLLSGDRRSVPAKFNKHIFVAADEMSKEKAGEFESVNSYDNFHVIDIVRSRHVGQSYMSSILPTLMAFVQSFSIIFRERPNLLICNGPGTCLPLCLAAFILNQLTIGNCRIVYVESVCRVKTLSLTGLILYHSRICDGFVVQWPELQKYKRAEYMGRFI